MQFIDKPYASNVNLMSPEHAYMAGRIKTSSLDELRNFQRAFPFNPDRVVDVFKELVEESKKHPEPPTDAQKVNFAFTRLLPRCYSPQSLVDWQAVIHFTVTDVASYTITTDGTKADVVAGLAGTPTATIEMDYETYRAVLRFEVIEDSHLVTDDQLADWETTEEMLDVELADEQLEAVAGGKGCSKEAAKGSACSKDGCGAAAGGGTACGAAACGAAACGAAACGADACGGAACAAAGCGGAACGAAGGAGSVCGGAVCGADACAAAACAAAACAAAACAAAACGADAGAGVCAGNACGANILGGADVGPCAVNVIPCVPFI